MTSQNEVYKLIGPVLVKQDQQEAKTNVNQRLDLIKGDMSVKINPNLTGHARFQFALFFRKRAEAQIKEIGVKLEKKKVEVSAD